MKATTTTIKKIKIKTLLFSLLFAGLCHNYIFAQKTDSLIRTVIALQNLVDECNDNFAKVLLTLNTDSAAAWINSIDNSFVCIPIKECSYTIQEKNEEYLILIHGNNNIKKYKFQENKSEPLNRIAFTCKSKSAANNNVKHFETMKNIFLQKAEQPDSVPVAKYNLSISQLDSITLLLNKNFTNIFFKLDETLKATINTPNGYFKIALQHINFNINDLDEKKNKVRFFGISAIEKYDKNMQLTGVSNRETLICLAEKNAREVIQILRYLKKAALIKDLKTKQ